MSHYSGTREGGSSQSNSPQYSGARLPTINTDIILPIYKVHVDNIINQIKNHEFRKYVIPRSVVRFWIYQNAPECKITHIAVVSPAKSPGEICDPSGLKNDHFDNETGEVRGKFAYEIYRLLELSRPIPRSELLAKGWWGQEEGPWAFLKAEMADQFGPNERTLVWNRKKDLADAAEAWAAKQLHHVADAVAARAAPKKNTADAAKAGVDREKDAVLEKDSEEDAETSVDVPESSAPSNDTSSDETGIDNNSDTTQDMEPKVEENNKEEHQAGTEEKRKRKRNNQDKEDKETGEDKAERKRRKEERRKGKEEHQKRKEEHRKRKEERRAKRKEKSAEAVQTEIL